MNTLIELNVEVAFGLPGVHNLPIWDALGETDIRVLGVRQEQTAGYAADGYARATGRLGVALVNTGPGAVHTLSAVGEAKASASPVLVIATDVPSVLRKPDMVRGVLHETRDQAAVFEPLAKAAFTVDHPDAIVPMVRRAARIALRPQSGPVYIGIPADFLAEEVVHRDNIDGISDIADAGSIAERLPIPALADIDRAQVILAGAEAPLIWAGGGALRAGAGEAIGKLAERLAAPIITTFATRGLVPPDHPCLAPHPVQAPEVGALWDEADVVLAVGTDFDGPMTQNWRMPPPRRLITVNVDPIDAAKNYLPDLLLTGDARDVAEHLLLGMTPRPGVARLQRRLDDIEQRVRQRVRQEEPRVVGFLGALEEILPERSVLVSDMCVAGQWVNGFSRLSAPRRLVHPLGWGTSGFGFPASLGVAAAGAERAVCITGDGGFLYGCGELATAAQENLPITVVIVNDGGYGLLRHEQDHVGLARRGVDLRNPDFAGLARSFGVYAEPVNGFGRAFRRLLREFTRADEPNVLVTRAKLAPPLTTSSRWYRQ